MDFIFDPSLVLYLPLYSGACEGSSFMSKDEHGHLCTVTGALWTPRGRDFDGVDDEISVAGMPTSTTYDTWEVWFKIADSGRRHTFASQEDGIAVGDALNLYIENDDTMACGMRNDTPGWTAITPFAFSDTASWHHVVAVYDETLKVYLDTVLKDTTASFTKAAWLATFKIGVSVTAVTYRTKGLIGEVRIYNRALTPLEIQHNYLATKWRYR